MFNLYIDDISIVEDGINKTSENTLKGISIFPNPAADMIYIKNENLENSVIGIYDLQGKLILETEITGSGQSIDIKFLDKGIYILRIENGGKTESRRIVKL